MNTNQLQQLLKNADDAYYNKSTPIMTDKEYDELRKQLPADTVPDSTSTRFQKYKHKYPLLSLDKIHDDDPDAVKKLQRFYDKCNRIILQPKLDGLTLAAVPHDGYYFMVTRGRGGIEGEVLPNDIGNTRILRSPIQEYSIRGEAYITEADFQKILQEQREKGESLFKNSRNAASGILRNLEESPYLKYVKYMVYEIIGSKDSPSKQLADLWEYCNFVECPYIAESHPVYGWHDTKTLLHSIQKFYNDWVNGTTSLDIKTEDIPIDGIVLKYDVPDPSQFGTTGHHPLNAIAWKKTADEYETTINDVTWQVGRNSVTPVAELEPVEIDGTIVSRATLHNLGLFTQLSPTKGDTVVVCKSGEIIPQVLRISMKAEGDPFSIPERCPCCNEPLSILSRKEKNRYIEDLQCTNDSCPERIAQNIAFLTSKDVLDIQGLSLQTARKIVEKYPYSNELVIFGLSLDNILTLPGFKMLSATKLHGAIQEALAKPVSLGTLFKSCCEPGIGDTIGTILAKKFRTYSSIMTALLMPNALKGIEGIGPKTIEIITNPKFIKRMNQMYELLNVEDMDEPVKGTIRASEGQHWVITGKFIINDRHVTRDEIVKQIESIGGVVDKAVSKGTDYLLIADPNSTSTKAQKARKQGVQLVSYDFLQGMLMA